MRQFTKHARISGRLRDLADLVAGPLLGVLTLPITITALIRSVSLGPADVLHEILKVPYMTAMSYVARLTTVAMSLGMVGSVAKIGEELRGRRAGVCVAAVCGVNWTLTYYAKTSNLDVPYLFWGCLGLLALVRAIARHEPRRLRTVAIMAVLAVGTKDQAYAMFLLGAPLSLALWVLSDGWARANVRGILKEIAIAAAIGTLLFLVVDGVLVNPSGFRARMAFLAGPASQDFAHYSNDALGRALVTKDTILLFDRYYPKIFGVLVVLGLGMHVLQRGDRPKRLAGMVPLFAAISFTVLFNWVARRTEHRFLLPQMVLWSVYAGIALEPLVFGFRGWRRLVAHGIVSTGFALAIFACAAVDANLLLDPRYDAEAWLGANVAAGDTVEVYGLNVYMPRFPPQARVVRVGHEPVDRRNPLPGVEEVQDRFGRARERAPRFIVVSQGWAWRYLLDPRAWGAEGYILPPTQIATGNDQDGTARAT